MTRGSRALTATYLAASAWLGWCAIHATGHAPLWAITLHVAASLLFVLGVVRELDLRDARRHAATLAERAARQHEAHNGRPLNQIEAADWFDLLGRLQSDDPRSTP
ncbi:hypothetical protein [Streptomyces sp. NPDC057257]|uniref:hypothetical protein n=1 Tax=Streptomyces sp. NPDC057257 TaxID=3346071 RepID=UPI00362B0A6F